MTKMNCQLFLTIPNHRVDNELLTNCRLTQVTEAIVKLCQGKRKCSLMAEKSVLSYTESGVSPLRTNCQESSSGRNVRLRTGLSNQLKVQYTCASKGIFRKSSNSGQKSNNSTNPESDNEDNDENVIKTANPNAIDDTTVIIKKGRGGGDLESGTKKKDSDISDVSSEEQLDPQASSMPGFDSSENLEGRISYSNSRRGSVISKLSKWRKKRRGGKRDNDTINFKLYCNCNGTTRRELNWILR